MLLDARRNPEFRDQPKKLPTFQTTKSVACQTTCLTVAHPDDGFAFSAEQIRQPYIRVNKHGL